MQPDQNQNPNPYPQQGQPPQPTPYNQYPGQPQPAQPLQQFPAPQQPAPGQNPYEFFMQPPKQQRGLFGSNGSPLKKYGLIAGIVAVVVVLFMVIFALATSGKEPSTGLITVAQDQQEIMRIAADGAKNSKNSQLINFAATAQTGLASDQKSLVDFLAKRGVKVDNKILALGQSSQTDQALSSARAANTYDRTFSNTIQVELNDYVNHLNSATKTATTKSEQQLLQVQYANAQLLNRLLQGQ